MKKLRGSATASVPAPIERCFELVAAVEGYPAWYQEVVRVVDVVERDRDGRASRARATLHVSRGPLVRDFHLTLALELAPPARVSLIRLPNAAGDPEEFEVRWRLAPQASGTRIGVELEANLTVPRLVPVGGIGDAIAEGFITAAERAISRTP